MKMQAWQEEVASARRGQRDAENKVSTMEAGVLCPLLLSVLLVKEDWRDFHF